MPPWSSGAQCGMLVVERVAKIRRADFQEQKTIKQICRESSSGLRSWDLRQHEDGGGYDLRRPRPRLQSRSPVPSNRWRSQAHSGRCAGTIWSSRRPLGLNQWRVNEWPCTPASGWDRACVAPSVRARWRRDRSRTRSALSGGGSSCLDRNPRATPNSMPGARIAVFAWARSHPHPELRDRTIWGVFQDERASLVPYVGPFDGFHAVPASVSKTCLVRFDKNRYSVDGRAVGRPLEIRTYAERVEFRQDGRIVGQPIRAFGRDRPSTIRCTIFRCWPASPAPSGTALPSRNGNCRQRSGAFSASWARCQTATGKWPRSSEHDPDRRTGCGGIRLRGGPERRRPGGSCGPEHPGPASRTATAADHRHAGCAAAGLRARGRLQTRRQPEETEPRKDHRCWTRRVEDADPAR